MRTALGIIIALAMLLCLSGCGDKKEKTEVQKPRLVKTLVVGTTDTAAHRSYPGRVSASQTVLLSFEVPGRLIQLPIVEGQEVKKAQLLARLDPHDYQLEVDRKKARYDHARATYLRYKELLRTDAVSRSAYDEKDALYKIAKADLETAKKALRDTYVHAPFSGYVAKRFVDNYQHVQAKESIISLQDITDVEIIINIPEQTLAGTSPPDRETQKRQRNAVIGHVTFSNFPGREFPVRLKEFSTEADRETQTYKVTLIMSPPKEVIILPGMTATVTGKIVPEEKGRFRVPTDSVATDKKGQFYVWIVQEPAMTVKRRIVRLGEMSGSSVFVVNGLKEGDRIVTAGVAYLFEGMKVKPLQGRIGKQ